MQLTFKKEFNGDMSQLPTREVEGAVLFKEPETIEKLSLIANTIGLVLMVIALVGVYVRIGGLASLRKGLFDYSLQFMIGAVLSLIVIPLHELLHAVCFRGKVEFYTYLKKGLCFVIGTESMSKARFVFMSLLPNLAFAFLPYLLFMFFPSALWLGVFGATGIGSGAGDYLNVFHAVTQMPKGALCFMSGIRSYWYLPTKE